MKYVLLSYSSSAGYQKHSAWYAFWMTLHALNRRAELLRLMRWAKRKRLERPHRAYQARLEDEELRLNRYAIRYPRPARWAYRVHFVNNLLFPAPRHYSRGSAPKAYLQHKKRKGARMSR